MMVPPGRWLGVLGGGQLGRMWAHAAQELGYRAAVYCPSEAPATRVADRFIAGEYDDEAALARLGELCDAVTTEFEKVPAGALDALAAYCTVAPSGRGVSPAQDRIREKAFFERCGVDVAPHAPIRSEEDVAYIDDSLLPGVLKTAREGYDGKGQVRVSQAGEISVAWASLSRVPCVLEKRLELAAEISVQVARDAAGNTMSWPVAENHHHQGVLSVTTCPARVDASIAAAAREGAVRIADMLDYVGVLCVEFFVLGDGSLVANEMAPRPHNSGHHTIDSCHVSQFEQQVRVMAGLPMGEPGQHSAACMVNLLGDAWNNGEPDWSVVLREPGARLHLYGKENARPGRKMGHFTVLAETVQQARATAGKIAVELGVHFA